MGDCKSSTTICDKNGRLQFYTDNETVWNSRHQVLANGTGLYSCRWADQGSVIVPLTSNSSQYYLITCDDLRYPAHVNDPIVCSDVNPVKYVLCLNLVDVAASNGKGEVLKKNQVIYGSGYVMSTIAAVKHANTKDTWLMTYDFDIGRFVALLLTDCGIKDTVVSPDLGVKIRLAKNPLTFSPKGDLLHIATDHMLPEYGSMIAHFDNRTGLASAPVFFRGANLRACFAVDNSYLYQSASVVRYKLSDLTDTAAIYASREIIPFIPGYNFGVQNGPDGKVYYVYNNYYTYPRLNMNSVSQPSTEDLIYNEVKIDIKKPINTLQAATPPNFVQSWFDPDFKEYEYGSPAIHYTRTCVGGPAMLTATGIPPATPYHWEIEEPGVPPAKYYNTDTIIHSFTKAGTHTAHLVIDFSCIPDVITRMDIVVDALPEADYIKDAAACVGNHYVLQAQPGQVSYLWNTGSTGPSETAAAGNSYSVVVSNTCGSIQDSVYVKQVSYTLPNLITPNNDSFNDTFEVDSKEDVTGTLEVYNAWGAAIYRNNAYKNTWPENTVDTGIYYYRFTYSTCEPVNSWLQVIY